MFLKNIFLSFFILISFVFSANSTDLNKPLGFEFGASRKDIVKRIEENDILILRDEEQTKDIRRIILNGSLINTDTHDATHHETRLEFYKNKLMSSALFFKFEDDQILSDVKEKYVNDINNEFGEALSKEKMLSFELWTWNTSGTKILLNSDQNTKSLKLEYLNEPILTKKIEKDIDKKLYGESEDPAKKTFLDGDYSKPKYGK